MILENEDLEIEVSNVDNYRIFETFKYIGMNQIDKENIKGIRGFCVRDLVKKLYFVLKGDREQNALKDFRSLIIDIGNYRDDTLWDISEAASSRAHECSDVMEMLYSLEESGEFNYDVDKEEISIKIKGMEPIIGNYGDIFYDINEIENNPELSNIFASGRLITRFIKENS